MPPNPNELVCAHIWVKGRVQGVGFRAHVEFYARQIGVSGWVRNVGGDTVEAVAQGARDEVERFIEMMKQGPRASRVDETRIEWEETDGGLTDFGVKRSL
jgi:acylphosphatase